jgi:hypothetical protein
LAVQVTRVTPENLYARTAFYGKSEGNASQAQAADELIKAVKRKIRSQDQNTILALSIGQPGYHAFPPMVNAFIRRFQQELSPHVKYRQVWLVGYSLDTTIQIHL